MTSPQLDERLRGAMGRPLTPTPSGDEHVDQAWARVRNRLTGHVEERPLPRPRAVGPTQIRRMLPAAAVPATMMGGAALLWWLSARGRVDGDGRFGTAPQDGPIPLPTAPSLWWAPVAVVVAVVAVGATHRLRRPLVTVAVALIAGGIVAGGALMSPLMRAGESLVVDAPTLPGYELVGARLHYWPDRHEHAVASMVYVRTPSTSTSTSAIDAATDVESAAALLGMTHPFPSRTGYLQVPRCVQHPDTTGARFLDEDLYCLESVDDDSLTITAHRYAETGVLLPRVVAYSLIGFGLIFLVVAAAGGRLGEGPHWRGLGLIATALCAFSVAGYLIGLIAFDVLRVRSGVDIPAGCRQGAVTGIVECREIVYPALDDRGALRSGLRIYWPLYVVADAVAAFWLAVGWVVALVAGMNRRRWLLFIGLTGVIVAVGLASQLGSADLIVTMSNLND